MAKNIYTRIQKYTRREFRPGYIFDIPVYLYFLYLALRARHIGFFSNINPSMMLSWFAGYGKHEDIDKFDEKLLPISIYIKKWHDSEYIEQYMKKKNIQYPCIAKPTLGRTGRDVKKIHTTKQLKTYLNHVHEDILIQEFIDYPLEFWIFYYRMPGENQGHITGIVEKKFMFLHGDGKSSFEKLVEQHPRARYYYSQLKKEYANMWENIIADWQKIQLNYIGNHLRWSTFYDVSYLITPKVEKTIDDISKKINGFYFGRYDIKAINKESLSTGDFKIIELNGMWSLPTHIYDPKHSIRNAYRTLFYHWKIAYRISKENKKRGHKFVSFTEIRKIIKQYGI